MRESNPSDRTINPDTLMEELERELAEADRQEVAGRLELVVQPPTLSERASSAVSYQIDSLLESFSTSGDRELSANEAPPTENDCLEKSFLYTGMGLVGLAYALSATSSAGFVVNEGIEYITAEATDSIIAWAIGLALNVIPIIPFVFALIFIWKASIKWLPSQGEEVAPQADLEEGRLESLSTVRRINFETQDEHDFNRAVRSQRLQSSSLVPVSGNHQARDHSPGHTVADVLMIGAIPGILGFAGFWYNINRISLIATGSGASLGLLIPVSLLAGVVLGFARWRFNSYYFHAAGEEGDDYKFWRHYKRTFVDNLWFNPDLSLPRKVGETGLKISIVAGDVLKCYFSIDAALKVTGLKALLPWWGNMLICLIPSLPPSLIEGVTATYCIDALKTLDTSLIHPVTKGDLIVGGIIDSLPAALLCATLTYQAKEGPAFWLANLAIFAGYSLLLVPGDLIAYYATLAQTPRNRQGIPGQSFDDVVRVIICQPRRRVDYIDADAPGQSRFNKTCCWFFRRTPPPEEQPIELNARRSSVAAGNDLDLGSASMVSGNGLELASSSVLRRESLDLEDSGIRRNPFKFNRHRHHTRLVNESGIFASHSHQDRSAESAPEEKPLTQSANGGRLPTEVRLGNYMSYALNRQLPPADPPPPPQERKGCVMQ